jgi:hypothetical protein
MTARYNLDLSINQRKRANDLANELEQPLSDFIRDALDFYIQVAEEIREDGVVSLDNKEIYIPRLERLRRAHK